MNKSSSRTVAAKLIAPVLQEHRSFQGVLESEDDSNNALVAELCYGTLRWHPRLNARLNKLLKKPLKSKDADITALLLIGLYQLEHMRIPDHAALDETVTACKQLKKEWAKGLVNAVLRNAIRQRNALDARLAKQTDYSHAHPHWIIKQIKQAWPEQYLDIFEANNERPPMYIRVNTSKISTAKFQQLLAPLKIEAESCEGSTSALKLTQPVSVDKLPNFDNGFCSVQDLSAQRCAVLLQLQPKLNVLDACAAPGGKTGHLLELEPRIKLTAMDISKARLKQVEENLQRLDVQATLIAADATTHFKDNPSSALFDRILLDAPCSGTGVIRRHPDIKLLRREDDIANFCEQQQQLLNALWPQLKVNGLLLYVTCSIMPKENEQQVARFLSSHVDAQAVACDIATGIKLAHGVQITTQQQSGDGFYYSLLRKIA